MFFFSFFFEKGFERKYLQSWTRYDLWIIFLSVLMDRKNFCILFWFPKRLKVAFFYSSLTPKTCNYFVFLKLHILYAYLQIFQTIVKTSYWICEWIPTTVKTFIKSLSPTLCWTEIDRTSIALWMSRLMLFKKWSKLKHLKTFSFVYFLTNATVRETIGLPVVLTSWSLSVIC